jgi:hypothetical protein
MTDISIIVCFKNSCERYYLNYDDVFEFSETIIPLSYNFNLKSGKIDGNCDEYFYTSEKLNYEEFDVISKIYKNKYYDIDYNTFNKEHLDYFNFDLDTLFNNILKYYIENQSIDDEIKMENNILIIQNKKTLEIIGNLNKLFELNYIPFRTLVSTGTYMEKEDYDDLFKNIYHEPFFVSLGDYDNILYARNISYKYLFQECINEIYDEMKFCDNVLEKKFSQNAKFTVEEYGDTKHLNSILERNFYCEEVNEHGILTVQPQLCVSYLYKSSFDVIKSLSSTRKMFDGEIIIYDEHEMSERQNYFYNIDINKNIFFDDRQKENMVKIFIDEKIIGKIHDVVKNISIFSKNYFFTIHGKKHNENYVINEIKGLIKL